MGRRGSEGEPIRAQHSVGADSTESADTVRDEQTRAEVGPGGWELRRTRGTTVHSGRKLPHLDLSERPEGPQGGDVSETASWLSEIQPVQVRRRGNGGGRSGGNGRRGR